MITSAGLQQRIEALHRLGVSKPLAPGMMTMAVLAGSIHRDQRHATGRARAGADAWQSIPSTSSALRSCWP
jgi:hypothetical protein